MISSYSHKDQQAVWVRVIKDLKPEIFANHNDLRVMCSSSTTTDSHYALFYVFRKGRREPDWIIKCHQGEQPIMREYLALKVFNADPDIYVPSCIGMTSSKGLHCLLLDYQRGVHHSNDYIRTNSSVLKKIVGTIANAQLRLSQVFETCREDDLSIIEGFTHSNIGLSQAEAKTLKQKTQYGRKAPLKYFLPQHGDFFLGNILFKKDTLILLDWETCGMVSIPFFDVWTLLLSSLVEFSTDSFKRFFKPSAYCKVAELAISKYSEIVSIPSYWGRELFPSILVRWILLNEYNHRRKLQARLISILEFYLKNADDFLPIKSLKNKNRIKQIYQPPIC